MTKNEAKFYQALGNKENRETNVRTPQKAKEANADYWEANKKQIHCNKSMTCGKKKKSGVGRGGICIKMDLKDK